MHPGIPFQPVVRIHIESWSRIRIRLIGNRIESFFMDPNFHLAPVRDPDPDLAWGTQNSIIYTPQLVRK